MNEKREKLNTFEDSRARLEKIERETNSTLLRETLLATNEITPELAPLSLEVVEGTKVHATLFEVDTTTPVPARLTRTERAVYVLHGIGWSIATLVAFGVNSIVLFFDAGLINLFFTTTGYLAYKQFKAAITGTTNACLKFTCTLQTVKKNISKIVTAVKNKITRAETLALCVECVA